MKQNKYDEEALLEQIRPEDLQSYGLIPEFIGRVPIVANLETLDVAALKNILTQPKNALVKQYTKMLELDNVELEFTEEALSAISEKLLSVRLVLVVYVLLLKKHLLILCMTCHQLKM